MLINDQARLLLRAINALCLEEGDADCDQFDDLVDVDESDLADAMFALHQIAFGVDLGEADCENKPEDAEQ